jgi:hypothetical protein
MLSTKHLVNDYKEVPPTWIFEHYCRLPEKLKGQDLMIHSPFNPDDKTPSFHIFWSKTKGKYMFNDFSTGTKGDAVDLVQIKHQLDFKRAARRIVEDYNDYTLHNKGGYDVEEFREHSRYKVTAFKLRGWNSDDQKFWTQFNIGSRMLEHYCVRPLESYVMSKEEQGQQKCINITGSHLYGYFTKTGELYKIYQPKVRDRKFIKVKSYIQGSDQLSGKDYLLITSSLKDLMAIKSLNLRIDLVAPDSENTMIPKELMDKWKKQYKRVLVLFDNDEAGIKAMKKYREEYKTPAILLTLSKDPADATRDHGPRTVQERLVPLIDNKICDL